MAQGDLLQMNATLHSSKFYWAWDSLKGPPLLTCIFLFHHWGASFLFFQQQQQIMSAGKPSVTLTI